jgi:hypothetical protein
MTTHLERNPFKEIFDAKASAQSRICERNINVRYAFNPASASMDRTLGRSSPAGPTPP